MSRRAMNFAEADSRSDAIIRSPSRATRLRSASFYQISTRDTSRLPQIAFAKRHLKLTWSAKQGEPLVQSENDQYGLFLQVSVDTRNSRCDYER